MTFGGTLTVDRETFILTLEKVADAALDNGFDGLVIVNGHGGNIPFVGSATSSISPTPT